MFVIYIETKDGWKYYGEHNEASRAHEAICDLAARGIFARWSNQYLGDSPKIV